MSAINGACYFLEIFGARDVKLDIVTRFALRKQFAPYDWGRLTHLKVLAAVDKPTVCGTRRSHRFTVFINQLMDLFIAHCVCLRPLCTA